MENMQSISQSNQMPSQPRFPRMVEYMARNGYWSGEPDVICELFRLAECGEAWAQFNAGKLCYEGIIVPSDEEGAEKWWRLAAEQGHPTAQWRLGDFYASRQTKNSRECDLGQHSASCDIDQAKIWLGKASQQGIVAAMGMRGGLESDTEDAIPWFRMGGEHGDVDCMFVLGGIYAEGSRGVSNREEAVKWYSLADERGHKGAPLRLGRLYEEGVGLPPDFAEASRWYRIGAEKGYAECQYLLGVMLFEGRGVPKDHEEAGKWLYRAWHTVEAAWDILRQTDILDRKHKESIDRDLADSANQITALMPLAEKEDSSAQFELGEIYRHHYRKEEAVEWHWQAACNGREDSKTIILEIMQYSPCNKNNHFLEAKQWVRELADSGNAQAQCRWAECNDPYEVGVGDSQDYIHWMSKSADQGFPEAQYKLAETHSVEDGRAFELYRQAALSGYPNAPLRVAECYFKGQGTGVDLAAALEWANIALKKCHSWEVSSIRFLMGNIHEAFNTPPGDMAAAACYQVASSGYSKEAHLALGRLFQEGRGVDLDFAESASHYHKALSDELGHERGRENTFLKSFYAIWHSEENGDVIMQNADRGDSNAQVQRAVLMYRQQAWDPDNDAEVIRWLILSSEQGHPLGQYFLGHMICSSSKSWNHPIAMQLFRYAAKRGLAEAQSAIAQHYRERADYPVAIRWFRMAAEQGEYSALIALGEMSLIGQGVPQDYTAASKWFRKASEWDEEAWAKRTQLLLGRNAPEAVSIQIAGI